MVGNAARENCSERTKDKCVHCEQKIGFIFSILLSSQNPRAAFFCGEFSILGLKIVSGQQDSNLQSCGNLPLISGISRLFYH